MNYFISGGMGASIGCCISAVLFYGNDTAIIGVIGGVVAFTLHIIKIIKEEK